MQKVKKYNARYFIDKFSAIPHKNWATLVFMMPNENGTIQCCALGHCGARSGIRTKESVALEILFLKSPPNEVNWNSNPTEINDYKSCKFPQPTPKERIIEALMVIGKAGG